MRILIVAPDSGLDTISELIAAVGGNRATILNGVVTTREVIGHIVSGQYDAIHFASHGSRDALHMSDGDIDMEQIESALRAADRMGHPVNIVVLNACSSVTAAANIYSQVIGGPGYVVGWRHDVPDIHAQTFAVRFWQTMQTGDDVHEAFDNGVYALQSHYPEAEPPLLLNGRVDDLRQGMRTLTERIETLHYQVRLYMLMTATATTAAVMSTVGMLWVMFN